MSVPSPGYRLGKRSQKEVPLVLLGWLNPFLRKNNPFTWFEHKSVLVNFPYPLSRIFVCVCVLEEESDELEEEAEEEDYAETILLRTEELISC